MKLIIDIPEEYYNNLLKNCRFSSEEIPIVSLAIAVSTPLEKHDAELLDKIRAEIEEVAEEESKHDKMWAQGLKYALKIIDKYRKGQTDADSD